MDLIPLDEGAGGGSRLELYLTPEAAELAGIVAGIAEAAVAGEDGTSLLSIPASAALCNRGRFFVFVESMDEEHLVYTMREIVPAGDHEDRMLVAVGLDEGEIVVATGAFRIDSAMQILGKTSLANLPDGELSGADGHDLPPYQPADRDPADLRTVLPGIDAWFGRYEKVRAALARDADAETAQPARELATLLGTAPSVPEGGVDDLVARLASSSRALSEAADLPAKRAAFEKITADMVLLARRHGPPGEGLNLVFCPMAFGGSGAYWLQPGDVVDNPYHGLEMPLCGWLVDAIAPYASGDGASLSPDQE